MIAGMLDQALDAAQALGQREDLAALEEAARHRPGSPFRTAVTMPPKPCIWRLASSCWGWLGRPG